MKTVTGVLATLLVALSTTAHAQAPTQASPAQAWPTKTITLIVPYAPGGYTDAVGRFTAKYLEKALGVTVIVDNKAGAGGIVGSALVAKAAPDGYTLCMCSVGAISVAPVAQKVAYDPRKDFEPISIVSTIPQTVIVKKSLPIESMKDLVNYAKANPDQLKYGSSGAGGLMHFSVALYQVRTGTKMVHIPYRGGAPATLAVVAGEVDLSFTNMTDALPQMEAGTVKALAVTSSKRSPFAPNLPTVAETGVKDFVAESWNGVMAPAGTPQPVIERISKALQAMAQDEEMKKQFANVGASTVFTTPAEYKKSIENELAQWTELVKELPPQ